MQFIAFFVFLVSTSNWMGLAECSVHRLKGRSGAVKFQELTFAENASSLWHGHPKVQVDLTVSHLHDTDVTDSITIHRLAEYFHFGLAAIIYSEDATEVNERTVCAQDFDAFNSRGQAYAEFHSVDEEEPVQIHATFYPERSGVQTVLLMPCWKQKDESFGYPVSSTEYANYPMTDPLLSIDGSISFTNPYGYLPALLYGLYPFNAVMSAMYMLLFLVFGVLLLRHRHQAISTQYFLLSVLVFATVESVTWFGTFKYLNDTGVAVCCPYPPSLLAAILVRILSGMVARVATTLVSLGYGVIRPQISWPEIFVVTGLGICYFIAVGALELTHLMRTSGGNVKPPAVWEILVILTNACFGGWIFTSLSLTKRNLESFGQTAKVRMYSYLQRVLYTYVTLSFSVLVAEGAMYTDKLSIPWDWAWTIWATYRLVLFITLLVIAIVWRPRDTSLLYVEMDQVPSQEPSTPASEAKGEELARRVDSVADSSTTEEGDRSDL